MSLPSANPQQSCKGVETYTADCIRLIFKRADLFLFCNVIHESHIVCGTCRQIASTRVDVEHDSLICVRLAPERVQYLDECSGNYRIACPRLQSTRSSCCKSYMLTFFSAFVGQHIQSADLMFNHLPTPQDTMSLLAYISTCLIK